MRGLPRLAVLLFLSSWPAGALAQQVLVSNLGQADFATASPIASLLGVFDHAQQFTTGSNSAGYRLNSVEIEFGRLDAGFPFSVSIRTNASGSPGTVVGTLGNPAYTAFTTDRVLTFMAAGAGIALAASTSYFVVLDVTGDSGSNFATWRVTTSMSEDSGGASGWSIADLHRFRQNVADAAWTNNLVRSSLKLRINGSAVTLPTVTIARVASPVTEGSAARFTVSRTGATTAALAVQLSVSEDSTGGRNFVTSSNEGSKTFSIPSGSASSVYSVSTVDDATDEPNGVVTVTVAAGTGYTVGTSASATVTVNDDDLPVVTIARGASQVTEGTAASFTVTRAGLTTAALSVSLTLADAAGSDFVASRDEGADTVTIAAGQASVAYRVATVDDNVDEPNGVVTVTLTAGTGYTVGAQGSASVTVNDDDVPGVLINGSGSDISASVGENGGSSTYTVQLATQPSHNVTLTVSSATANAATVNKAGGSAGGTQTLTFTPSGAGAWNVAQTITVTGYDNSRDDANNQRSSVITHTAASSDAGYDGISGPRVTVTVTDDDTPELTVSAQNGMVGVNESAAATIVVTSSIPVDGSIDHGQPTVSAGGSVSASATTIAGGRVVNSYTVTATDNNQDEPDWSITTGIGAGSGYTLGTPSSITLTVRDNDPTIVSLAGGGTLFEGETAAFTVTLGRVLAADETIDVPLALSGVNVVAGDWSLALDPGQGLNAGVSLGGRSTATPQVTFTGAGARTATLLLTAAAGSGGKTLRVELGPDGAGANGFGRTGLATNVGGGASPHPTARAFSLTITADAVVDDRDFVVFSPRQGAASGPVLPEGEQRVLTVHRIAYTPDRSGLHIPNAWGFRLCFTGTATPGADYHVRHGGGPARLDQDGCTRANNAADGTAVPAALDRVPFYIALLHDDLDEAQESVIATLSRTFNTGVSGDGYSETRFTIEEPPLIDKVRHYTTEIARGWDHVLRWRRALHALSGGAEGEGPAMAAAEAQGYADQGWMRWVSVAAALTALEGAARSPQRSDAPPALPAISIAGGAAVTEGGDAAFTLRAVPAPATDLPITVTVSETGSFAAAGEVGARTVTVGASGTADFAVATDDDGTDEADGSVTATLNAGDGYALGQPSAQTVNILDDDEPAVACAATSASLVAKVRGYYELNRNRADRGYGENWLRVLIAFGAETHATLAPYTAAEARMGERLWSGWRPVREELERLEACNDLADEAAVGRTLSISDAAGSEGETLKFTITLSPPLPLGSAELVRVLVETRESSPVSARENSDYQHNRWWLTFSPGQTEQSYWIHALDDAHDDGGETFEMVLSRPVGASIADAVGVGTISNADPLPAAYLARFGRTVAEQALDGIAGRMQADRAPGMQGSFAGLALGASAGSGRASGQPATGGADAADNGAALAVADMARSLGVGASMPMQPGGASGPFGDRFGAGSADSGFGASPLQSRAMTMREVLLGSSFSLTGQADGSGGSLAFWGRTAQGGFNGAEGGNGTDISLDGTVTTGILGADYARGNWLVGLALTRSSSTGSYAAIGGVDPCSEAASEASCVGAAPVGDGKVAATLPAAVPYAALRVSERLKLWGAAGYGAGEVMLKTMGESHSAGTSWAMAATGMRGEVLRAPAGGPGLAVTSDALWVRTASEEARDFAASSSDVTRLRLGLEGSWRIALENGGALTPKLALGARHDGGDAETGFGIELGGGLAWSAPGLGLALDLEGRTLITHEDGAMRDRGFSASLAYDPAPDSALGLSLALRQELGGASSGGLSALLADGPLSQGNPGLGGGGAHAARWAMEAGFGLPILGGRFVGTPHLGHSASGGSRDWSLGWRLTPEAEPGAPDLSLGVLAMRREGGPAPADHGIQIEFAFQW